MQVTPYMPYSITPSFASIIVKAIYDATGDDINEDVRSRRLKTQNSTPFRIWDLINTNVCREIDGLDCITHSAKRGPWELVIIYDTESKFIYTIMREKRFRDLHRKLCSRKKMHYVDMLARHLNPDLLAPVGQIMFEPVEFEDEKELAANVQTLLSGLMAEEVTILRHVMILFESSNLGLTKIRAVMVDSNLDIVVEENWSEHIPVQVSTIADTVSDIAAPSNKPTRTLKLSSKALERKKKQQRVRTEQEDAENYKN